MNFLKKLFLKLFGYIGVVDAQIDVYVKLKKGMPEVSENEVLNNLIFSRIQAIPRVATKKEEYSHYELLLNNPSKTFEDVIWEIIKYEFFESREAQLKAKIPPEYLAEQMRKMELEAKEYIKNKITRMKNDQRNY